MAQVTKKNREAHDDKETIARLQEALATMNTEYMKTKLELDTTMSKNSKLEKDLNQMMTAFKETPNQGGVTSNLKFFGSKMKHLGNKAASKMNEKLQLNSGDNQNENNENGMHNDGSTGNGNAVDLNGAGNEMDLNNENDDASKGDNHKKKKKDKTKNLINENKVLLNKTKELTKQISELQSMVKSLMKEKDQLKIERDELMISNTTRDEQFKRMKEQQREDAERYEKLLNNYRNDNKLNIENTKSENENKLRNQILELEEKASEFEKKYLEIKGKYDEKDEDFNERMDLIISERNKLTRKVKSLQQQCAELMKSKQNRPRSSSNPSAAANGSRASKASKAGKVKVEVETESSMKRDDMMNGSNNVLHGDMNGNISSSAASPSNASHGSSHSIALEVERRQQQEIDSLKSELIAMKKKYNDEKNELLTMVKKLSSYKSAQNSMKQSDVQQLVTNLSALLAEKEDIITGLRESKIYLGKRVMELEKQINNININMNNNDVVNNNASDANVSDVSNTSNTSNASNVTV